MKKILLKVLLFLPFFTQANIDDLENAVRESNINQVKKLLQEENFLKTDILCMIELSRDTLSLWRDLLICCMVQPGIPTKALFALVGSAFSLSGFLICAYVGLSEIIEAGPSSQSLSKNMPLLSAGVVSLTSSLLLFRYFTREKKVDLEPLETQFKNTIQIKQLLLRYKPAHI